MKKISTSRCVNKKIHRRDLTNVFDNLAIAWADEMYTVETQMRIVCLQQK